MEKWVASHRTAQIFAFLRSSLICKEPHGNSLLMPEEKIDHTVAKETQVFSNPPDSQWLQLLYSYGKPFHLNEGHQCQALPYNEPVHSIKSLVVTRESSGKYLGTYRCHIGESCYS